MKTNKANCNYGAGGDGGTPAAIVHLPPLGSGKKKKWDIEKMVDLAEQLGKGREMKACENYREIEHKAALLAYEYGLGASEWLAFIDLVINKQLDY